MRIVVTGASGLIGSALSARLLGLGHDLVWLRRSQPRSLPSRTQFYSWDPMAGPPPENALTGADAIVHLAGEPVAQRWSDEVKLRIRESRVVGTRHLVDALAALPTPPRVLLAASAIGFYGPRGEEELTESSAPGSGFLAGIGVEWEAEANRAVALGVRVVNFRISVVLSGHGGALERMLPPFRLGAGGPIGDGRQWMSWIHLDDLVGLAVFCLETTGIAGPVNACSPEPVRNVTFTKALASALHRPAFFTVPPAALYVLYGEMAQVVLESQRVLPQVAERLGFGFRFPKVDQALRDLLKA